MEKIKISMHQICNFLG